MWSVGNRWGFKDNWIVGVDWFRIFVPLIVLDQNTGDIDSDADSEDKSDLEDVVDTVLDRMGEVQEIILVGDYVHGNDSGKIEIFLIGEQLNMDYIAQLEEKIEKLIKRKISFYLATKFLSTQPNIVLFHEKNNR